jgi:DNA polymerase-4
MHQASSYSIRPCDATLASVSDTPRKIIHLDMDAFYASVEQREDPALHGKPVAVGGAPESRGVVAACNYEARKFGVHSAMPMARAVRQCPDLVIVRPNFTLYKSVSQQVMDILRSATTLVEPLSLDEAYLDVTVNLLNEPLAMEVAKYLKARIRDELSLTASAGVAPNKFLAKIASGWKKPDGLTVIAPERVESFLQKLPVEALWGVGPVTAKKLHAIGVVRLVDVRAADRALLTRTVGSLAEWLVRLSHGDDPREVTPDRPWKSISAEDTYATDLEDVKEMRAEIERLARRVADSLQKKSLLARTVTIKVRYANFTTVTRSHTEEPATHDGARIIERALALLERTDAARRPVRLLGVGAHGLLERDDLSPSSQLLSLESLS